MGICRTRAPAFVAAVLAIFLAVPFASDRVFAMDNPSDELVEVDFGERGYLIPRRYVSLFHRDPRGRSSVLEMRPLWPTLEPRSPETARLWQQRDTLRHLRVTLSERGNSSYYKLNSLLSWYEFAGPVTKPALQLEFRSRSGFRIFSALDGYTTPAGEPYAFFCNDVPERSYELFDVELLCIAEYQLGGGAWIRVHFFEANIANWKAIDVAVRQLIRSFER